MIGWGVFLIIMGVGSLILPEFGIQFRLMSLLDDAQPIAGIVVAAIGALLVVLGIKRNAGQSPASAQPAPPAYPNVPGPPPPQQQQAAPGAPFGPTPAGHCTRCGQPLWAGDAACRTCGLPTRAAAP